MIFLTYKPLGRADGSGVIKSSGVLKAYLGMIDHPATRIKIGCDACFVPSLLKATKVEESLIDSCECGFFSVYIDENLEVMPCSFCNDDRFKFDLRRTDFREIWQDRFSAYRNHVEDIGKSGCVECDKSPGRALGSCFYGDLL